jgi:hypothetical protein
MKKILLEFLAGILTLLIISHPFVIGYYAFDARIGTDIIPAGVLVFLLEALLVAFISIVYGLGKYVREYVLGIE